MQTDLMVPCIPFDMIPFLANITSLRQGDRIMAMIK
jgi:hypothetical protein